MAYPSGYSPYGRSGPEVWDEAVPPDYDADTLPNPHRPSRADREFYGNGRPPDHHQYETHPENVERYPGYPRDNPGLVGSSRAPYDGGSHPDPLYTRERGPDGYTDLGLMENGPGRFPSNQADNPAFSLDETDDRALRRRFTPHRKQSRKSRSSGRRNRDDDGYDDGDNDSIETISPEDLQRTRDFLATIRVKRRLRQSLKRSGDEDDGTEEENYEEMQGLPSARAQYKIKPLAVRLRELHKANAEADRVLREKYTDFDPSLVASAARKGWARRIAQIADVWHQLDIWSSHFKEIEGRFGSATTSYFRFTRWLLFLNFYTFLVSFLVIVVPFIASTTPSAFVKDLNIDDPQPVVNGTKFMNHAINCSATYSRLVKNVTDNEQVHEKVLDFFMGTGWMETTLMFYGHYHNRTYNTGDDEYNYNMGLAYMLAVVIIFLISFVLILMNSSHSVKDTVGDDQEQSTVHFTNSVLCGWDYCIFEEKTAKNKKNILYQEFKADLLEQNKRLERQNLTNRQKLALLFLRVVINFVVICILGGALYLIYFTTSKLLDLRKETSDQILLLIIELLPSLTITGLNFLIPIIFEVLVSLEDYWPAFELKISLIRMVFVRLSSLGVLTFSLYYTLLWPENRKAFVCDEEGKNDTKCCGNYLWEGQHRSDNDTTSQGTVKCWETYVGQQFYKLAIVDFAALVVITFFVEFPRKFIYDRFKERFDLVNKYGTQEFDIPRNVLDIVYSQSLSWLGMFFAPMLPVMTLIKVFLIFYIKKLTLLKNFAPPQHVYKVSKSNSFFNFILLISILLVAMIIGYMLGNINPSKSCGPYRLYSENDYVSWVAVTDVIAGWPEWASKVFFFFGTTAFFVPCFVVLCLLMYYYWAVGQGYKRMDEILQEQLKLEAKDKQFLLARVNNIIKQGNLQGVTGSMAHSAAL